MAKALAVLGLLALVSCASGLEGPRAPDASVPPPEAGPLIPDGGDRSDAGPVSDAGPAIDAGVAPADAGPAAAPGAIADGGSGAADPPIDAGISDPGPVGDAGEPVDAGAVALDAGSTLDAGPVGGAVDAGPRAECPIGTPETNGAGLCVASPFPTLPGNHLDGGVPGPCDRQTFDAWGTSDLIVRDRYDAAGRLVSERGERPDGGSWSIAISHDQCGNDVWRQFSSGEIASYQYGPDGLLAREVFKGAGCRVIDFSYQFDSRGNLVTKYGSGDAQSREDYGYDDSGRLISVKRSNDSSASFEYLPSGTIAYYSNLDPAGSQVQHWYDAAGRLVRSEYADIWGDAAGDRSSYDADGHPVKVISHFEGSSGAWAETDRTLSWEGGVLIAEDATTTFDLGAGQRTTTERIDYEYPDSGVSIANKREDGVLVERVRTTSDQNGNAVAVDSAKGPAWQFIPVSRTSYDCWPVH